MRAALAWPAVPDESLAARSDARVLITACTREQVEGLARRIHTVRRGAARFVQAPARDIPVEPVALRAMCLGLVERAKGGSLLLTDVEDMPRLAQDTVLAVLDDIQCVLAPSETVRLLTGTTVCLFDRVTAGTFSDRLFYHLNLLHLKAPAASPAVGRRSWHDVPA